MYKLISLDLDDTLWPCMPTIEYAESTSYRWLQQHCPEITASYTREDLRIKRKQLIASQPQLIHNLSAARCLHFSQLADEFSIGHHWIEDAFNVFLSARQQVTLFDDVLPVLQYLKQHYVLVALTNGNADVRRTGLGDYFQLQISAADVNAAKPDPSMFLQMLTDTGVTAEECLHVGDHPVHDIQGAANAGVPSVWINRQQQGWQESSFQPDYIIHNLHQLISLIEPST